MILGQWLNQLAEVSAPIIDLLALVLILAGTLEAFVNGIRVMLSHPDGHYAIRAVWMRHARWLIAGLTFQLAADIIETSVAPSWDDVGRLAAIAVIRTFLNFFLERDQREARELQQESEARKMATS
ncbi:MULTISPECIES: DUF1622 domain-containing protein [Mesorhizobium]|uniref:DUF1622 domain-containing protein n=1 Tax=Rhizobium loti TaxID=381 RepID=A0AA91F6D9_RHILI|nr:MULTISPECIES: DUF1622 domain-containing protein [Mesorhizobium]OBQ65074.1 hypothetical protein A8145_12710 [Mesorhizobium loti]QKC87502.1 DUF1622 domain-containing protein [Mesorhizobium sp. NZP2234]